LTRQPHHHRQHQHCHADVVHEGGQSARGEHDHGHQRGLVAAGQAQHVSPDQVAHAGSEQPLADDEHGPERNHGLVAEAGHRLGGRDQPGDGECAHHQQGDDVHAQRLGHEKDQGDDKDRDDQGDIKHQPVPYDASGLTP